MISRNKEFYSSVRKEEWHIREGRCFIEGISQERKIKCSIVSKHGEFCR